MRGGSKHATVPIYTSIYIETPSQFPRLSTQTQIPPLARILRGAFALQYSYSQTRHSAGFAGGHDLCPLRGHLLRKRRVSLSLCSSCRHKAHPSRASFVHQTCQNAPLAPLPQFAPAHSPAAAGPNCRNRAELAPDFRGDRSTRLMMSWCYSDESKVPSLHELVIDDTAAHGQRIV